MTLSTTIAQDIQAEGTKVVRQITPTDVEANIACEHYFTAADGVLGAFGVDCLHSRYADTDTANGQEPGTIAYEAHCRLTFCVLVLRNGFAVTGESACASPEKFNAEIGREIARQNAVQKIWPLMGYELRSKLAIAT